MQIAQKEDNKISFKLGRKMPFQLRVVDVHRLCVGGNASVKLSKQNFGVAREDVGSLYGGRRTRRVRFIWLLGTKYQT